MFAGCIPSPTEKQKGVPRQCPLYVSKQSPKLLVVGGSDEGGLGSLDGRRSSVYLERQGCDDKLGWEWVDPPR